MIEVRLTEEHLNRQMASESIAMKTVIGSVTSKGGHTEFKKLIERLTDGRG